MGSYVSNMPLVLGASGNPEIYTGAVDPTVAGIGSNPPLGSLYVRTTDGLLYRKASSSTTGWSVVGASQSASYGAGGDGAHTVVGTETLTRDVCYTTLLVPNGTVLQTDGFAILATVSVTVEAGGIIRHNGGDTATNAAGAGATVNTLGLSQRAGSSGGTTSNSSASTGGSDQPIGMAVDACRGGQGGSGTSTNGGTPGSALVAVASYAFHMPWALKAVFPFAVTSSTSSQRWGTGSGGTGGGGGGSGNAGGGGGGAGGIISIGAPLIVNDGLIQSRGGNGAPGQTANAGGGGGGGGGKVIIAGQYLGSGTISVAGGAGGAAGGNPGTNAGANGNAGHVLMLGVV